MLLNRWPQHRDGRRWENELARPEDLIPHDRYHVTYVCDSLGRLGVPLDVEDIHVVEDFAQIDSVLNLVDTIVTKTGRPDHVIAFSEYLLDLAALIRERHGVPGQQPIEIARFRDKRIMKNILNAAGVRVPQWRSCRSLERVLSDANDLGFPLIFKPARGASSQGVCEVASPDELRVLCTRPDLEEYEIEEYIAGDIMHADGVVDRQGNCLFMSISRYVSTCLAFEKGEPFGSVIQTDSDVVARCREFALRCLAFLNLKASAFHLEFFDTGCELVFLEIGARVPGADVSYVIHEVFGVNLFQLWTEVILGNRVRPHAITTAESGGWLMVPRPKPLPQTVITSTSLLGVIPHLYRELIPEPGSLLEQSPGYATLQGGRFLFRGGSQHQILSAMKDAVAKYSLTTIAPSTLILDERKRR